MSKFLGITNIFIEKNQSSLKIGLIKETIINSLKSNIKTKFGMQIAVFIRMGIAFCKSPRLSYLNGK